jgi:hypothetical protein
MSRHRKASWAVAPLVAGLCLAVALPLVGQEKPAPTARPEASSPGAKPAPTPARPDATHVQRVFPIQNVSPDELAKLLSVFPAAISVYRTSSAKALGVSAAPAVVSAIEETIKRLDVPAPTGRNIELTGYVLEGGPEVADAKSVPSDLEGVVAQLKRTFGYPTYRLSETLIGRMREGSGFSSSSVGLSSAGRISYSLKVERASIGNEAGGTVIRLDSLHFGATIPSTRKDGTIDSRNIGSDANVDIRDGQRVVVGKSGLADSNGALILVLSAKVVD